jgi:O-antigen/teichoic acid export membrane protein
MPGISDTLSRLSAKVLKNPLIVRVLRNSGVILSANSIASGLGMVQGILAARMLGVAAFGMLSPITQFVTNINRLTSFRMGELIVSYVGEFSAAEKPDSAAAVFKAAALVESTSAFLAFLLVIVLAPLGARVFLQDLSMVALIRLYAGILLANLFSESATGLLQYYNHFRFLGVVTVIQSVVTLLVIAAAWLLQGGLAMVVLAYMIGKLVGAVTISAYSLKVATREWGSGWITAPILVLRPRFRELIRFALSTNISGTVNLVTRDSDTLWLSALSSPLQVGYYKVAKAFMNVLVVPINPMISTTYRELAREITSRSWKNVRYLLRTGTMIAGGYSIAAAIGMVVFGPWLVSLYGDGFGPAYAVMLVLLAGFMVANTFYWSRTVFLPLGMPEFPTKVAVVMAVFEILVMVLLVPRFGAVGLSAALTLYFLGNAVVLVGRLIFEIRHREQAEPVVKEV